MDILDDHIGVELYDSEKMQKTTDNAIIEAELKFAEEILTLDEERSKNEWMYAMLNNWTTCDMDADLEEAINLIVAKYGPSITDTPSGKFAKESFELLLGRDGPEYVYLKKFLMLIFAAKEPEIKQKIYDAWDAETRCAKEDTRGSYRRETIKLRLDRLFLKLPELVEQLTVFEFNTYNVTWAINNFMVQAILCYNSGVVYGKSS
jgi:hypothetical protein